MGECTTCTFAATWPGRTLETRRAHSVVGAFYRIHSTRTLEAAADQNACTQAESGDQLGCLAQASACSLSLAGKRGGMTWQTRNLALGGIEPTVQNIQRR